MQTCIFYEKLMYSLGHGWTTRYVEDKASTNQSSDRGSSSTLAGLVLESCRVNLHIFHVVPFLIYINSVPSSLTFKFVNASSFQHLKFSQKSRRIACFENIMYSLANVTCFLLGRKFRDKIGAELHHITPPRVSKQWEEVLFCKKLRQNCILLQNSLQ